MRRACTAVIAALTTLSLTAAIPVGSAGATPALAAADRSAASAAKTPAQEQVRLGPGAEATIVTTTADGSPAQLGVAVAADSGAFSNGTARVFADPATGTEVVVEPVDVSEQPDLAGGVRQVITITDAAAPTRYPISVDLPEGAHLTQDQDGTVTALDADGNVLGMVGSPWAYQAGGDTVPTRFEITESGDLVQVIDHHGASYPVIADPAWFVPVFIVGSRVAIKVAVKALTKKGAQRAAARSVRRMGYKPRITGTAIKGSFKTAGNFTIKVNKSPKKKHGYESFDDFKAKWGSAGEGRQWHHVVEQSAMKHSGGRIKNWMVHNRVNLVAIPKGIHQKCINGLMATKLKNIPAQQLAQLGVKRVPKNRNQTLREYQKAFSFENLHLIGLRLLALCGVEISGSGI